LPEHSRPFLLLASVRGYKLDPTVL